MATDVHRLPTGNEYIYNFNAPYTPGGACYEAVNDPIGAPDTSEYIQPANFSINYGQASFSFSPFSIPQGSTINFIRVTYRINGYSTAISFAPILKINGTHYTGGLFSVVYNTWTTTTYDYIANPDTGMAWALADVVGTGTNPLQAFGVAFNGPSTYMPMCTQVYLTANYSAGAYAALGGHGGIFSTPAIAAVIG